MPIAAPALCALVVLLCAPAGRPRIAEVLYDPAGDDTDREFVELSNPGPTPWPLAGLRLEAGDGSGPGRWSLRWTGGGADTVAGGGRFVIGGARLLPPPHAVVRLDLQNGPDAVRLVWPDGAIETVGYGAHEFAEYACGAPAADAASGFSLARIPDESDAGSNALDFRAAVPSPGRANQPGRDAALEPGSLALEPALPEPGAGASLGGSVANRGRGPILSGEVRVLAAASGADGTWPLLETVLGRDLAPGDTARFEAVFAAPPAGRYVLRAALVLAGDENPDDDADSLTIRVGGGPLRLAEIQFHPAAGEGEWVEVRNAAAGPLDLADFTLADRGAGGARPSGGEGALAPESLAVLAQSRAALLARFPALDPRRVWQASPWPALNNGDDSTGVADVVVLREADGTPSDRVAYSAAGVPAGVPLEWRDGGWWPATEPAGTPLAPPRALAALRVPLALGKRRVAAAPDAAALAWDLPWPRARIALEVYDLAGHRVARPIVDAAVPARGERAWDTSDLSPGVYVVLMRARPEGAGAGLSATAALRVDGVAP